jgi:hypothetical protein
MYGDRDVAVQAPQDVLERSPEMGIRPPGRKLATLLGDSLALVAAETAPTCEARLEAFGFGVRWCVGAVGGMFSLTRVRYANEARRL